ncbi:nucleoside diphosphate-linked moiety X motif 13 [Clupea harengus]|uniref:NAD(+) diphosphatase n=1 Tax=Clupea harengus TaxID=7950 RepID=A0A6P8FJP5_CLUHA|nr:nucleoside diphosphate-linked moiety X motif 13 [Clupea harengus]XP_031423850.1 nucleoside diphosphate-linked moiety X motif 13 [Clupea harengus]
MLKSLRTLFWPKTVLTRSSSSYVARIRYLMRLKEDDEACLEAMRSGSLLLYHTLAPLLQKSPSGLFQLPAINTSDFKGILDKLGKNRALVNESVLIGCTEEDVAQFSLDVGALDKSEMERLCGGVFIDLRKAFFLLRGTEAPLVARGQALLRWHQTHGFCSASGHPSFRNQSGSQRVCHSSGHTYYPKMSPVVIALVSDGSRCLLGRQATFPRGMYSALAGFCDMGETIEETLRREIAEEVGLELESLRVAGSQHWPFPQSSFMVACHATVAPSNTQVSVDLEELEDARWFTLQEVQEALRLKKPPRNPEGETPTLWLPPRYAIAHQLVREWVQQQIGAHE